MDKKVFIINYKETTFDSNNTMEVDCGTFDYAYDTEDEAKKVLIDVAQKKVDDIDEDDVMEKWNKDRDYVCVGYKNDTYEYSIYMVTIIDNH